MAAFSQRLSDAPLAVRTLIASPCAYV